MYKKPLRISLKNWEIAENNSNIVFTILNYHLQFSDSRYTLRSCLAKTLTNKKINKKH